MRLINVKTLELEGFIVDDAPPYAILSHTWGDDEVTYQDWQDQSKAAEMAGYAKIKAAIEQTIVNELKYLWVDTNCIDKSSSAELSEAINSMFLWYQRAKVCFVYLADIEIASEDAVERRAGAYMFESLKASRWFYRGWTLQELLAPKYLEFFSKDWQSIACLNRSRKNPSDEAGHLLHLVDDISKITGIRKRYLWDNVSYKSASIADRMYWASSRLTFRTEDKAYCLLGIFNINMPLLYGEGRRAFQRLQEEIIKISTDQSIFAWEWLDPVKKRDNEDLSILAPWPSAFTNRNISRWPQDVQNDPLDSIYTLSNFGLSLRLPIWQTTSSGTSFAVLDCMDLRCVGNNGMRAHRICIPLSGLFEKGIFERAPSPAHPIYLGARDKPPIKQLHIPRTGSLGSILSGSSSYAYRVCSHPQRPYAYMLLFPSDHQVRVQMQLPEGESEILSCRACAALLVHRPSSAPSPASGGTLIKLNYAGRLVLLTLQVSSEDECDSFGCRVACTRTDSFFRHIVSIFTRKRDANEISATIGALPDELEYPNPRPIAIILRHKTPLVKDAVNPVSSQSLGEVKDSVWRKLAKSSGSKGPWAYTHPDFFSRGIQSV